MTDKHSQSFFGQITGLTIQSSSKNEPYIFLTCVKKKTDGSWEKPSLSEGKTIKCSLDEMVMILKVLKHKINSWIGYHTYKEKNTQISFSWEDSKEQQLWISIGDYSKMLGIAQIEIFKLLLKHLIEEKIEFATISNVSQQNNSNIGLEKFSDKKNSNEGDLDEKTRITTGLIKNDDPNKKIEINGSINAETEKAFLILLKSGQEIWIPKSAIYSRYVPKFGIDQSFIIDNWLFDKIEFKS